MMKSTQYTDIILAIQDSVISGLAALYQLDTTADQITMNVTRKEFEGDYTVVVFPYTKATGKKPELVGQELGDYILNHLPYITKFNVVKGFLNLTVSNNYWFEFLEQMLQNENYGQLPSNGERVLVEFSSPNTNKPLHLGHIRNILLGWATSRIYEMAGYDVVRVQIVNDRGIAICKSMLAWLKFGDGATPESSNSKSDHFVGNFYVLFEIKFREEYTAWQATPEAARIYAEKHKQEEDESTFYKNFKNEYFNHFSALGQEAKQMLLKWEDGDEETLALWRKMNGWVYQGFEETYKRLGVWFDKLYYESDTYLLGKELVDQGLKDNIFYQKTDGSVWIDLESAKLDHKLVLRSDGTSVYITQDIGTAQIRYKDFGAKKMIYVVADEQNYHFQVLFEIMKRLGEPYANGLFHLSYGMVDLPTGKMKSREGTVVDADDLIAEVISEAKQETEQKGTLEELPGTEKNDIIRKIGLGALKFFIVKVNPKKRMVFDPKESVDMQGQTGPYIQNAYVRMQSVLRRAGGLPTVSLPYENLETAERDLISQLYRYPELIQQAANEYDPSLIANYCYDLAKGYHKFWHDFSILSADSEAAKVFRLKLSHAIAQVLKSGMDLLGIEMPDRM